MSRWVGTACRTALSRGWEVCWWVIAVPFVVVLDTGLRGWLHVKPDCRQSYISKILRLLELSHGRAVAGAQTSHARLGRPRRRGLPLRRARPRLPGLHRRHRGDQHRALPPARGGSRPAPGEYPDPRPVHDRDAPAAAGADRTAGHRAARRARPAVLRQLRKRSRRSRRAPGPPGHRAAEHHRLPRWFPRAHHGCRCADQLGNQSARRHRPDDARVVFAPFPETYRHGWSQEQAVAFALAEFDHLLATVSSPRDTAAVIVEPVLGEGGYIPAPPEFLEQLRHRADEHGFVLIVDEVQTGV